MRILVVDRSTGRPGMAVFEGGALAYEHLWEGEPSRAPGWLAELAGVLAEHGSDVTGLDAFVCGLGPGSFSGIRACLAALGGLALPGGRPVYGVASAAALALGEADGAGEVSVVGDARRGRLWCVTYRVGEAGAPVRLADGRVPSHTAEDFRLVAQDELAGALPAGSRIVTPDWSRLGTALAARFDADRLAAYDARPSAAVLGELAVAEPAACLREPRPLYLHPAVGAAAG